MSLTRHLHRHRGRKKISMAKARLLAALGLGQFISVLLALTGFISTNITERGFVFPVLQSSGFYFFLCFHLVSWPFPLRTPVFLYALLALLDVEANFLAVMAYQYTDITSILLLNSLTIPWIVILSFFVLKRRYSLKQVGAMFICLVGLGLVIGSDTLRGRWSDENGHGTAWIGDLICVGSSFLYACQNVLQEYLLKRLCATEFFSNQEYLGMLGLFGFLFSTVQWLIFERQGLVDIGVSLWTSEVIGLFAGFSATMVVLYILLAWFIGNFDASLFNMSILTSGIYGIVFEFIQRKASPRLPSDWMYILAYALIVVGVVIYSISDVSTTEKKEPEGQTQCCDS